MEQQRSRDRLDHGRNEAAGPSYHEPARRRTRTPFSLVRHTWHSFHWARLAAVTARTMAAPGRLDGVLIRHDLAWRFAASARQAPDPATG